MDLQGLNSRLNQVLAGTLIFLSGCSGEKVSIADQTADSVYSKAQTLLQNKEYEEAAKSFKDVETYFPYAEKAVVAQIMAAYCNFMSSSYVDTIREVDIFLRYHPSHELVPYAMYLRANAVLMNVSSVGRDSHQAEDAKEAFVELVNRFPNSIYAKDALKKIILLDDIIAAHEMMIGRYYQKNKNGLAAKLRYNRVVALYPNTKSVEEAYYRLAECCHAEELYEEEKQALAVLRQRFPNGEWVKKLKNS